MAAIQQHKSLPFLLLLLTAAGVTGGGAPYIIKSTCARAKNATWLTPYRYCVRTLSADPAAASARDARGLAVAAADLTATNVTSTMVVLAELMDSLEMCMAMYKAMNRSIVGALDDLRAGRLDAAWPKIKDASYGPTSQTTASWRSWRGTPTRTR
ncbi:hypothetical protein ACQ4PT_010655 [Festuca glaucescens]